MDDKSGDGAYSYLLYDDLTMNDDEIEDLINSKVKVSIDTTASGNIADIVIDVCTDDPELMRWILSFQEVYGRPWHLHRKEYFVFKFKTDAYTRRLWQEDYFNMVDENCTIDDFRTSVKAIPGRALYNNYMKWIELGKTKYGIDIEEVKDYQPPRFKASMRVPSWKNGLIKLLINYGYTWLKPVDLEYKLNRQIKVVDDNINVIEISKDDMLLQYNWKTNEILVGEKWLPHGIAVAELLKLNTKNSDLIKLLV